MIYCIDAMFEAVLTRNAEKYSNLTPNVIGRRIPDRLIHLYLNSQETLPIYPLAVTISLKSNTYPTLFPSNPLPSSLPIPPSPSPAPYNLKPTSKSPNAFRTPGPSNASANP